MINDRSMQVKILPGAFELIITNKEKSHGGKTTAEIQNRRREDV